MGLWSEAHLIEDDVPCNSTEPFNVPVLDESVDESVRAPIVASVSEDVTLAADDLASTVEHVALVVAPVSNLGSTVTSDASGDLTLALACTSEQDESSLRGLAR